MFIKIVDDSHMTEVDTILTRQVADRRLPNQYKQVIEKKFKRSIRTRSNLRMFYMRHLAYAMTVQQHHTYSAYVSQREDTFFLEPLDFKKIGFDYKKSNVLNGEPTASAFYSHLTDARAYVFLESYCEWGSYSDKIHIGNDFAMSALWGKTWQDFAHIILRYGDFGYARASQNVSGPYQTEAFLQDLLNGALVTRVDVSRTDARYMGGRFCVPSLYFRCLPRHTKMRLTHLGVSEC